jgi:hypothetical protein
MPESGLLQAQRLPAGPSTYLYGTHLATSPNIFSPLYRIFGEKASGNSNVFAL